MNLIKKFMQHNKEDQSPLLSTPVDQKLLYTTSSAVSKKNRKAEATVEHSTKCFMELPNEIQIAILKNLTYDDIAKLRRTCKLMNTLCSYLLNRGFQQLGIDIDKERLRIKRELPRRESMRRSHRLSRLNDAYAGLDTRFSIMTMTYWKFIDIKATCFIPGKVLDEFFRIIDILKKSHDRGGMLTIDIHELLKDLRDLSSMAMEHFEEHVQPSLSSMANSSLSSTHFMSVHPLLRPSSTKTSSPPSDGCEWRKSITDKLAQQDKVIKKQNLEITSLKSCVRQLVAVCTQLSTCLPSQEQEISNVLDVILDTISLECPIVYYEEPSTSNRMFLENLFTPGRKRNHNNDDSRGYNAEKRLRLDDECTRERLI